MTSPSQPPPTTAVEPGESEVERVARALCELRIRTVRRHDTEPAELERMLPEAVDYSWSDHIEEARAAIASLPSRESIEAETVAAIVAWLRGSFGNADAPTPSTETQTCGII